MSLALLMAKDICNHYRKEIVMAATFIETAHNLPVHPALAQERWREKAGEYFWFSVCLILFMILGPFAAPIALGFVFSNQATGVEMTEPRPTDE